MAREKPDSAVRESILVATRRMLEEKRYDQITVAAILEASGAARGSFYFYFDGKADVLAELVTRVTRQGQEAAAIWDRQQDERTANTRQALANGAKLWRAEAPVLRAIVENWRSNPKLTELWLDMMGRFAASTSDRIEADGIVADPQTLAAALTWLGERLYYLAAIGVPPFDDEDKLVDVLTHIWLTALAPRG
jgi:AcrR family transcriptional regulator